MPLDPVRNFAKVTVSTGYDAVATSIVLVAGEGAKLPDPAADGAFNLVWWNDTDHKDPADDSNKEIVRCTARTTDTLTITRAQEGTTATVKNIAGKTYKMVLAMTKKMKDDINFINLPDTPASYTGEASKIVRVNSAANAVEFVTQPPVGFVSKVWAHQTAAQSIAHNTVTVIDHHAEIYDGLGEFNLTTNKFTVTEAGYYLIIAKVRFSATQVVADKQYQSGIAKNGVVQAWAIQHSSFAGDVLPMCMGIFYLAAGDFIEHAGYHNAGVAVDTVYNPGNTELIVHRLS